VELGQGFAYAFEFVTTPFPLNHDSCWQPRTYVKPEAAITVFQLLMMSGGSSHSTMTAAGNHKRM
jgi:hypothetical protein